MRPQTPALLVLAPYGRGFWSQMLARLDVAGEVILDDLADGDDFRTMAERIAVRSPRRFAVLGFCMGGCLALELLRLASERISRLALISVPARADSASQAALRAERIAKLRRKSRVASFPDVSYLRQAIPWLLSAASLSSPEKVRAARELLLELPLSRSADQQQAMLTRSDHRATLQRNVVPTIIVSGSDDRIVPPRHAQEMSETIPNSSIHVLERCGHLAPLEAPAELAALISRWLAGELDCWKHSQLSEECHVAAG